MRRSALALAIAVAGLATSPAIAQTPVAAMVIKVVDSDTLDAQLNDGTVVRVQLIGIDAPEPGDCGGGDATGYLTQLALGRNVTLVSDPTLEQFESTGNRPLFYVDRDDGRDLGLEMVRAGWADIWFLSDFQRSPAYVPVAAEAERAMSGVWDHCDGDFHFNRADELREERLSAIAFIRRYYRRVSNRQFQTAWGMLGRQVRRDVGTFKDWRAGHRRSRGVSVLGIRSRLSQGRAVVNVRIRSRDRDACSTRIVRQTFRGFWVLAPRRGSWVAVKARIRKTGGATPRLSRSECAPPEGPGPPPPPPPPPPRNCDPSYPGVCIPPYPPDLDCDDVPYEDFPVRGRDPHGFDSDGDGRGCES